VTLLSVGDNDLGAGSRLGDHNIGTRQKFGQFVAPLLKGLDPHP
jgi:hypothetical protein